MTSRPQASSSNAPGASVSAASAVIFSANHSSKSKFNKSKHSKKPQKVEDDLYCKEPPIWMQSMMLWMD
jgi:hypothetical protein